jgi:hypothetical protein
MHYETNGARAHAVATRTPRAVREAQARGGDLASLRRAQQSGRHPDATDRTPTPIRELPVIRGYAG